MKVKSTLRYTSFTILKIVRDARNLTLKEVSSVLNKTSQFYSEKKIIVEIGEIGKALNIESIYNSYGPLLSYNMTYAS